MGSWVTSLRAQQAINDFKEPHEIPWVSVPGLPPLSNTICGCADDLEIEIV